MGATSDPTNHFFDGTFIMIGHGGSLRSADIYLTNLEFRNGDGTSAMQVWFDSPSHTAYFVNCLFTSGTHIRPQSPGCRITMQGCVWNGAPAWAIHMAPVESHVTIRDCLFQDIDQGAGYGGAVYCTFPGGGSTITVYNTTFRRVSGSHGSLIYATPVDQVTIEDSLIEDCTSTGEGIINLSGVVVGVALTRTRFIDNAASGTVFLHGGITTITSCSFIRNTATYGGALSATAQDISVSDSFFSECQSAGDGGALRYDSSGTFTLSTTDFCLNSAPNDENTDPATILSSCPGCGIDNDDCCPNAEVVVRTSSSVVGCQCLTGLLDADGDCTVTCPDGQYDGGAGACLLCTDFGDGVGFESLCTLCNISAGCSDLGCEDFITTTPPRYCYATCPSGEYPKSASTCGLCSDFNGVGGICGPNCNPTTGCLSCTIGYLTTATIKSCVSDCSADEYGHEDGSCHPCSDWNNGASCDTCIASGCDSCSSGYLNNNTYCNPCSDFDNGGICGSSCSPASGCASCIVGYRHADLTCHPCSDFDGIGGTCGSDCDPITGCDSCTSGYLTMVTNQTCVANCGTSQYEHADRSCHACSDYNSGGSCSVCTSTGCDTCSEGYLQDGDKRCYPCSDFGDGTSGSSTCTSCTEAMGCLDAGCSAHITFTIPRMCLVDCPANEYALDTQTCGDCDTSFGAGVGGETCTACDLTIGCSNAGCSDYLSTDTQAICVTSCQSDEYKGSDMACHSCEEEFGSDLAVVCIACNETSGCFSAGCTGVITYSTPAQCVAACPPEEYSIGDGSCGNCNVSFGSFSGQANPSECNQCTSSGCENAGCGGWLSLGTTPIYCLSACSIGQYANDDMRCHDCDADFADSGAVCSVCDMISGCTDCDQLYSLDTPRICITGCPAGQYVLATNYCANCTAFGDGCTSCTLFDGCENAGCSGVLSIAPQALCLDACPSDGYDDGAGQCQSCSDFNSDVSCSECNRTVGCTDSGCGAYLSPDLPANCVSGCVSGQYPLGFLCRWCNTDYGTGQTGGADCSVCNENQGCTACSGLLSTDSETICLIQCPLGEYNNGAGQCVSCDSSFGTGYDSGFACSECSFSAGCLANGCGMVLEPISGKNYCRSACPATMFWQPGGESCQLCDEACDGCSISASNCTACANVQSYGPSCDNVCASTCKDGACHAGHTGDGTCTECLAGYCGDMCKKELDKCDVCGGNGLSCEGTDALLDLLDSPNQIAIVGGAGLLLMLFIAAVIVLIAQRSRMKRRENEKEKVLASSLNFVASQDESVTMTVGGALDSTLQIESLAAGSLMEECTMDVMEGELMLAADDLSGEGGGSWMTESIA